LALQLQQKEQQPSFHLSGRAEHANCEPRLYVHMYGFGSGPITSAIQLAIFNGRLAAQLICQKKIGGKSRAHGEGNLSRHVGWWQVGRWRNFHLDRLAKMLKSEPAKIALQAMVLARVIIIKFGTFN